MASRSTNTAHRRSVSFSFPLVEEETLDEPRRTIMKDSETPSTVQILPEPPMSAMAATATTTRRTPVIRNDNVEEEEPGLIVPVKQQPQLHQQQHQQPEPPKGILKEPTRTAIHDPKELRAEDRGAHLEKVLIPREDTGNAVVVAPPVQKRLAAVAYSLPGADEAHDIPFKVSEPEASVSFDDDLSSIGIRGDDDDEEDDDDGYENDDVHSEASSTVDLSLANHSTASSSVASPTASRISTTSTNLASRALWEYWSSTAGAVEESVQGFLEQDHSKHVQKMLHTSSSFLETTANSTVLMDSFNQSMEVANGFVNQYWTTTTTTTTSPDDNDVPKTQTTPSPPSTPPHTNRTNSRRSTDQPRAPCKKPASSSSANKTATVCQPLYLPEPPLDSCLNLHSSMARQQYHPTKDDDVREMDDLHLLLGEDDNDTSSKRETNEAAVSHHHQRQQRQQQQQPSKTTANSSKTWSTTFDLYDLQEGEVVRNSTVSSQTQNKENTRSSNRDDGNPFDESRPSDSVVPPPRASSSVSNSSKNQTVPEMTTLVLSRHDERQLSGLYSQAIKMTRVSSEPTNKPVKSDYSPFDSLRAPRRKKKELNYVPPPFGPSNVAISVQQSSDEADGQYAPAVEDEHEDSILNMTGSSYNSEQTSSSSSPSPLKKSATFSGTSDRATTTSSSSTVDHQIWLERQEEGCNKIISHSSIELVASRSLDRDHAASSRRPKGFVRAPSRLFRKADKFPQQPSYHQDYTHNYNPHALASGDALAPSKQ